MGYTQSVPGWQAPIAFAQVPGRPEGPAPAGSPGEREAMVSFVQTSDWDDRAARLLSYYGITTEGRD